MTDPHRLRSLVASVVQNIDTLDDHDDAFQNIVNTTRRCFRPNRNITPRGRRPDTFLRRKTFLVRKANSDFFPIKAECEDLAKSGLGYSLEPPKFKVNWTLEEAENYICNFLFPYVPLNLVGFKFAKLDRSKRLIILTNISTVEELKEKLGASQLVLVPHRDLPATYVRRDEENTVTRRNTETNSSSTDVVNTTRNGERDSSRENATRDWLPEVRNSTIAESGSMEIRDRTGTRTLDPTSVSSVVPERDIATLMNYPSTSANYVDVIDLSERDDDWELPTIETTEITDMPVLSGSAETVILEINRHKVVEELVAAYQDDSMLEKSLKVNFVGEEGDDFGGLTKEVFTVFWEECKTQYFRGENILVPKLEICRKKKDAHIFRAFGKILTHMVLITQTLPMFISRTSYLLIGNVDMTVPREIVKEDFLLYVTNGERSLLNKARTSFDDLEHFEKQLLEDFFTTHEFFDIPREEEFEDQLQTISEHVMISKQIEAVKTIREGIPLSHEDFWVSLTPTKLLNITVALCPTPNKVIQCIKASEDDLTSSQSAVLYYLNTFIRNMNKHELTKFLIFATGSSNMPHNGIKIAFTTLTGSCRRPIAHTCSNLLELPTSYADFFDFSKEFAAILNNDLSFTYTQL